MSVNREIQVGLCTLSRSRRAETSASLRSWRVGPAVCTTGRRSRRPGQHLLRQVDGADAPTLWGACRSPAHPSISTSAIIQLVEGSKPTKSIPADLRTRLRPPSQPDEVLRSQRRAVRQLNIDPGASCAGARTSSHEGSAPRVHRPSQPGWARRGSATTQVGSCGGWGSR